MMDVLVTKLYAQDVAQICNIWKIKNIISATIVFVMLPRMVQFWSDKVNIEEELKDMEKDELIKLVLHIVGMYTESDLPFVYCPVCGQDLRDKK